MMMMVMTSHKTDIKQKQK